MWKRKNIREICRYHQERQSRGRKAGSLPSSIVSETKYLFCAQSAYTHRCAKKAVPSYCRTSNAHSPFLECCEAREMSFLRIRERPPYVSLFLFLFLFNTHTHFIRAAFRSHTVVQTRRHTHVFDIHVNTIQLRHIRRCIEGVLFWGRCREYHWNYASLRSKGDFRRQFEVSPT